MLSARGSPKPRLEVLNVDEQRGGAEPAQKPPGRPLRPPQLCQDGGRVLGDAASHTVPLSPAHSKGPETAATHATSHGLPTQEGADHSATQTEPTCRGHRKDVPQLQKGSREEAAAFRRVY